MCRSQLLVGRLGVVEPVDRGEPGVVQVAESASGVGGGIQ
jgi:hypothetical protein